jgi:hypothetical protein
MRGHRGIAAAALVAALVGSSSGLRAEDAAGAAKALADKSGYSWVATSQEAGGGGGGDARRTPGPTEGRTEKGGCTRVTYKMGDTAVEVVVKGDKAAVKTADGWKSSDEVAAAAGGANADAGQGGRRDPSSFMVRRALGMKLPAAEAADLAGKAQGLKEEGGAIVGTLPEETVKEILSRRGGRRGGDAGGNAPTVTGAKGSVTFWIKDGVLVKYEVSYQGTVGDRQTNRTTVTEIKDVGTTKVEVPEDAKKKLP